MHDEISRYNALKNADRVKRELQEQQLEDLISNFRVDEEMHLDADSD